MNEGICFGGYKVCFWAAGDISMIAGCLGWQSAAFALWESFFCLGVCLGLVVLFRERFNSGGKFARFLADNSFSVYVFHPPILIQITLALRGFSWHPLVKFGIAAVVAVTLCFIASRLVLRRIPLLKRVFIKVSFARRLIFLR